MIHLHLIGYTADLDSLVLDLHDEEGRGRYRLVVDGDLFATLDEVRSQRRAAGKDVGVWPPEGYLSVADLERYLGEDLEAPPVSEPPPTATAPRGAVPEPIGEEDLYAELEDELEAGSTDGPDERDARDEVDDVLEEEREDEHEDEFEQDELRTVRLVSRPISIRSTPDAGAQDRARLLFDDEDDEDDWEAATPTFPASQDVDDEPDGGEEPVPMAAPVADDEHPSAAPNVPVGSARAADEGTRAVALPDRRVPPAPLPSEPKLSPAEIQARLRAGKSPRAVAKAAGTDVAWIERWLPPILAERHRVLERARAMRLHRSRLGASRDPLGRAVERNLRERAVDLDEVTWDVGRRQDGRWRVSVRFSHRGRVRSATWLLDPERDDLSAASDLARELGFTRSGARGSAARRRS